MKKKRSQSLTKKQQRVLDFLENYHQKHQYAPSLQEIGNAFGISAVAAMSHLRALERKGMIRREPEKPRAIDLLSSSAEKPTPKGTAIPLLGRVAAGTPLLAEESIEEHILIASSWANGAELFALRVKGDSMIEEHILNGDIVLVRKQSEAQTGDIVVALIEDARSGDLEATVKKYLERKHEIVLKPCHPTMAPLHIPKKQRPRIAGKVIGLIRKIQK